MRIWLTGNADGGMVAVWKTRGWPPRFASEPLVVVRTKYANVDSIAFSPDGERLIALSSSAGTRHGNLDLWNTNVGNYSRSFVLDLGVAAHSVAFRSDGKQLAIASWDGTVRVYDASTLKEVRVLHGHRRNVYRVAYSHDCERLVTCGWDDTVRLWDSATGNRVDFLGRHDAFVRAVAFNPDGQRIASGGQDNTVRFWEAATSREIGTLRGHSRPVSDVAFSPDGQQIASASGDGTVKIWETTAAEPAHTFSQP